MGFFKDLVNNIKYNYPWEQYYKKDERNIEVPDMSIYDYLVESSEFNLSSFALNYFNNKITYRDFFKQIDLCARALKSQGIREGDVVTICMANTPEAVISFYAINKIGGIANMLHPLSAIEEIKKSLISTNSVMLITLDLCYSKVKEIIHDTMVYKTIICGVSLSMPKYLRIGYKLINNRKIEKPKNSEEFIYWDCFIDRGKNYKENVLVKRKKDDDAIILHSGGTTGVPKNIVLTNGNVNAVIKQVKVIFNRIENDDSFLSILPLFHCFGLVVCIHAPLCLGASCILVPKFDAKRFDKLIKKYNPTILAGVPTLYEALINNKHDIDLSSVKYVISGGDSLSSAKNKEVNEFLINHGSKASIIQGYGMTESTGPVTFGGNGSNKLGSVGIPFPSNLVKIVEPNTGIKVEYGEVGEICLSGPSVMKEYLNDKEATHEILKEEDGRVWLHTGDLGYMDSDGVLFYVQRLKRMIIVSGYNVYPSHVEEVIMNHSDVVSCGVIGIPHPYKVQVPKAYIVLKNGIEASFQVKKSIKEYCKRNLASYMIPKEFEFRKSLPKTMIGKVDYKNLDK